MDLAVIWAVVAIVLGTLLLVLLALLRVVFWPMYIEVRDELDELKIKFDAVVRDRDGWRSVAERSLLVAQIGRNAGKRAVRVIDKLVV